MNYGMYVSAAGALANTFRQDVIANNLANADTVGFKKDLAMLTSRPTEVGEGGQRRYSTALLEKLGGGLFALPTHTDYAPAGIEPTENPYDVALLSEGFYQVQTGDEIAYTRDGRFLRDQQNRLVTLTGNYPVLDAQGNPIELDPTIDDFHVAESGLIFQEGEPLGQLGIVNFSDKGQLRKQGANLFTTEGNTTPTPAVARVKQGYIEESGVEPVREMVDMIHAQRMFQTNISMMRLQDETMAEMIRRTAG